MHWSNNIIGLKNTKQHLQDMVAQNRLSHALLFLGKEGSGALPLAISFAQNIVCLPKPAPVVEDLFGGMSAMQCNTPEDDIAASNRAEQLIHPDLHLSFPVIPRKPGDRPTSANYIAAFRDFVKLFPYGNVYDWLQNIGAENKQGNITVDECNDIIKKLSLKAYEAEYKVLVMWMPEYLGKEGNKLLKLIEEPPANTIFILVAENEENILPTILSRCQLIKIPKPEPAEIEEALITKANTDAKIARQIAGVCEGNYREALLLLQHAGEDWHQYANEWLKVVLRKMLADQIKWVDEISKIGREKQKQFLRYLNHLLEQAIRLKILSTENILMSDSELDFAQRINKIASVSQVQAIIEEIDKAHYYIERNANGKILFTALSIKLYHIIQNKIQLQVI